MHYLLTMGMVLDKCKGRQLTSSGERRPIWRFVDSKPLAKDNGRTNLQFFDSRKGSSSASPCLHDSKVPNSERIVRKCPAAKPFTARQTDTNKSTVPASTRERRASP